MDTETEFRSLDGTALRGTLTPTDAATAGLAVLVHGAGVTREEGGFFARVAAGLAEVGVAGLRFDLRAHGASAGRQQEITIAGIASDIRAAADHARELTGWSGPVHVLSASFSGGAACLYASHRPADVNKLVLLNPRLDYRERYTLGRPEWDGAYLRPDSVAKLDAQGYTGKSPFEMGRGLLNEVLWWDTEAVLAAVRAPALVVHGTKDTFVDVELSRRYAPLLGGGARLVELDGAQHGFAVHEDPGYLHPQSQAWQREVIELVRRFLVMG